MQVLHAVGVPRGEAGDGEHAQGHAEVKNANEAAAVHVKVLLVVDLNARPQIVVVQRVLRAVRGNQVG